jgi:choline-glycine betaine transporter
MSRPSENTDNTELAKTSFEYFKHYTTLSASAAVAVATLSDLVKIDTFLLVASLGGCLVCLILSNLQMTRVLQALRASSDPETATYRLFEPVGFAFLAGVLAFASMAIDASPRWVQILVAFVLVVVVCRLLSDSFGINRVFRSSRR